MNLRHTRLKASLAIYTLVTSSIAAIPVALAQSPSTEQDPSRAWFTRAWGGLSSLPDTRGTIDDFNLETPGSSIDVSLSGGFAAGAGIGYRYNPRIAVELAWEYRSNDSETDFESGTRFDAGNYASNTFFLNGFYNFDNRGRWEPYVGAGLSWVQEIDIDLEGNGPEQSFSGDGDFGVQLFLGSNYRLTKRWSAHGEVRYGVLSGIDLEGENVPGNISDLDYDPLTLQFGINYRF